MNNGFNSALEDQLKPFKPTQPLESLIVDINRIYHEFEAQSYDRNHPEITAQLVPIWTEMLTQLNEVMRDTSLTVLDYGCGTGFATLQLLQHIPLQRIRQIVCYDVSQQMLDQAQEKLRGVSVPIHFTSTLKDLEEVHNNFNVILTNSVIHHLPSLEWFLNSIQPMLIQSAVWVNGHEPSNRFYRNVECMQVLSNFRLAQQMRRLPGRFLRRAKKWVEGLGHNPKSISDGIVVRTAAKAYELGLFQVKPAPAIIPRLVDVWVPVSMTAVTNGAGFDYQEMQVALGNNWKLLRVKSYSFMGTSYEGRLSFRWQKKANELADKYPMDGANYAALWQYTK